MPSLPGTYQYADWVSLDCLRLLTNMLGMSEYANFGYQDEFKKEYAVGDTVRVKFPNEFIVTDGFEYTPQAINRQSTTITVDQPMQIAYEWDSIEAALKLERNRKAITEEYNNPAMAQMASEVEMRFMDNAFYNSSNVVGTLASIPTTWDIYAQADQVMTENSGNNAGLRQGAALTPGMMRTLITNSLTQFNPADAISRQYKTGIIGEAAGSTFFKSMYCHPHTTGVWATVATGVTVNAAGQSGASITCGATTGDTVTKGDHISFASVYNVNPRTKRSTGTLKRFKITAAATAALSAITLSIYPSIVGPGSASSNVNALPANGDIVTLWPGTSMSNATARSGVCGIVLNKNAFALAGVDLMIPEEGGSVKLARKAKDPKTGLTIAMISMFDPGPRKQINRIDMLIGNGVLYGDRASCLVASLS